MKVSKCSSCGEDHSDIVMQKSITFFVCPTTGKEVYVVDEREYVQHLQQENQRLQQILSYINETGDIDGATVALRVTRQEHES